MSSADDAAAPRPLRDAFALEKNARSLWFRRAGTHEPVDGLRALAVLWVIAYHTFAFVGRPLRHGPLEPLFRVVNRGLLGVDVFFVLSGFLIGSMLMREAKEAGRIAFGRFYLRRAMRILPAYFVVLAVFCVAFGTNADTAWANVLFVNDLLPDDRQCMRWSWSLAVEEQFYIVFPLVLALVGLASRTRLAVFAGLFALCAAIRAAIVWRHAIYLPTADHAQVYYDTLYDKPYARFGELVSGVVAAQLYGGTRAPEVLRRARAPALTATLASLAIVVTVSLVGQPVFVYGWPPWGAFAWYTLSGLVFAAAVSYLLLACLSGAGGGRILGRVLAFRGFYPVSQLSYSAYLLHVMIITGGLDAGAFQPARDAASMLGYLVLVPAVCLVAAAPLYLLVEKPAMNLRDWIRSRA